MNRLMTHHPVVIAVPVVESINTEQKRVDKKQMALWKSEIDWSRMQQLQRSWEYFDRTTALGCAQRNQEFDSVKCQDAWQQYNATLMKFDVPTFPELQF